MIKRPRIRMNFRELLFILLTLLWCAVIFAFSAQKADDSTKTSSGVIYLFCRFVVSGFKDLDDAERYAMIASMQFWVRKAAHFVVYLVLGILGLQIFLAADRPQGRRACCLAATGLCIFYAVSDEVHQYFVPGRACQLRDICIDTLGAAVGILLSAAVMKLIDIRRSKKA